MDPNKSPSAPQAGWSDEKTSMVQAPAPPPYQDYQYQGSTQPGPGYPQQPQAQGYGVPPQQAYGMVQPGQPGVITMQPTVYVTQGPLENPVEDYLCYSIFTMICCCFPLGIAALIYSISAREANHAGNRMVAERQSRTARTLNHVALGLGLGGLVLSIIYVVVVLVAVH